MRRDFLAALSFANICYLRVWTELLTYRGPDTYLMATPPRPVEYAAVMVNVLLMGTILWGLGVLAERHLKGWTRRLAEMAVVVGIAIPINGIRAVLSRQFPYLRSPLLELLGPRGAMLLGVAVAVAGLVAVLFLHRWIARAAIWVFAALSPFCIVTFGQAIWQASHYNATAYANRPPAPMLSQPANLPRVAWFIADEWDYRLTFVDRDPSLQLPEIDRLRQTSLFATNALPPGDETPVSIPGYYAGVMANAINKIGPRQFDVAFKDLMEWQPWASRPNVFSNARKLGANTALLEWYHATCRIIDGISYCKWWPMAMQHNSMGEGFFHILINQTRSLFETNILSLFGRSLTYDQHTAVYHAMMGEAEKLIGDRNFAFTLVHLPIPHAPHAYDRRTGQFTLGNKPIKGYIDSLALLDRTIRELRATMQKDGTWDDTTVIFTSDHPYREAEQLDGKSDPRIPYLVKLGGQKSTVEYGHEFNTVLTADLVLAILRGEVRDPAGLVHWLDAQPPAKH